MSTGSCMRPQKQPARVQMKHATALRVTSLNIIARISTDSALYQGLFTYTFTFAVPVLPFTSCAAVLITWQPFAAVVVSHVTEYGLVVNRGPRFTSSN